MTFWKMYKIYTWNENQYVNILRYITVQLPWQQHLSCHGKETRDLDSPIKSHVVIVEKSAAYIRKKIITYQNIQKEHLKMGAYNIHLFFMGFFRFSFVFFKNFYLVIKAECQTKFLYFRSLVFLIGCMLSLLITLYWLWMILYEFFFFFLGERKCFSGKLDITEPLYFCYESVRNKTI